MLPFSVKVSADAWSLKTGKSQVGLTTSAICMDQSARPAKFFASCRVAHPFPPHQTTIGQDEHSLYKLR
jgi:hypothetical protein